ncbi:hypothetical protein [Larkinella knui]|uniref:Uncharacterized protein n=1 Tax=Larkinella knui TaxID=2025310 RepID=A0A3P1CKM4_9BACT|nr:hypothetical protein [Larkinella knui]RRB13809.1 hypothetical protein EHT87_16250 [Larkinella knui]
MCNYLKEKALRMSRYLLKSNLINLLGYVGTLISMNISLSIAKLNSAFLTHLNEVFYSIADLVSITFVAVIYTSVFWLPALLLLWGFDSLLMLEFGFKRRSALFIEWVIICIPLILLFIDDFTTDSYARWIPYPFLIVGFAISQFYKGKYLKKVSDLP